MALPIILRNIRKINGLHGSSVFCTNLARTSPFTPNICNANFSQLTTPHHRISKQISEVEASKHSLLSQPSILVVAPNRFSHGNHSLMWTAEKALSAALIGVIPAAFAFSSPLLDNLLVFAVVTHQHWGIEAMVIDYVRPIIFGRVFPKIALALVYMLSAATLGGLLYFNYNDIGVTALIKKLWALGQKEEAKEEEEEAPVE